MKILRYAVLATVMAVLSSGLNAWADGVPEFDTDTRLLNIPLIQVNGETWFSGADLLMGLNGRYDLLDSHEVRCDGFGPADPLSILCGKSMEDIKLVISPGIELDGVERHFMIEFRAGLEPMVTEIEPIQYPGDERLEFKPGCNGFGPDPGCD